MQKQLIAAAEYGQRFSQHDTYRHGAIIERATGSKTRYYGSNSLKTTPGSPKPEWKGKTICAEFDAVLRASRESVTDFTKYNLYVARYGKDGLLRNSKPCVWCDGLIRRLEFKGVYHS